MWLNLMILGVLLSGCPSVEGPSDDAVGEYVRRQGGVPSEPGAGSLGSPGAPGESRVIIPKRPKLATRVLLTVESGEGLPDEDDGPGVTDPYVIVEYEGQHFRTSVVEGELSPVWGDSFVLQVIPGGVLQLSLVDEDSLGSDHTMGVVSQPLPTLGQGERVELVVAFRKGEAGTIKLTLVGLVAEPP